MDKFTEVVVRQDDFEPVNVMILKDYMTINLENTLKQVKY